VSLPKQNHRTFTTTLLRHNTPNYFPPTSKDDRKAGPGVFGVLGWTLLALVGGGLVFETAYCMQGFFYYKRKVKDIWEDAKGPFRKGKDAWDSRKERKKMEKKQKKEKQKLEEEKEHKEWLDTLPLTDPERKVAESEVVMNGMVEMIEREAKKIRFTIWMAKEKPKLDDSKDLIRVNTKKREIEKRDEYDVWANGLGLGVEERKVLEKLKGATGERIIRVARSRWVRRRF
jgi:hypothetical protein